MQSALGQQSVIDQLLVDFANYRNTTANVQKMRKQGRVIPGTIDPTTKSGKKLVAALSRMVEFCTDRQIDPRLWVYTMFKARKFLFAPKPEHFCSEKHISKYHALTTAAVSRVSYAKQQQLAIQTERRESGAGYDQTRDITPAAEVVKERYVALGEYQRCIDEMQIRTLGFHPRSRVCTSCPAAQACLMKLQGLVGHMDIVAIRAGQQPPQRQAELNAR